MVLAFIIWSIVSFLFTIIGILGRFSKKPIGFWANTKTPEVSDVKKYNRAVSNLWLAFSLLIELSGIPLLFCEQNNPIIFISVAGCVALVLVIMVVYLRIEIQYKK